MKLKFLLLLVLCLAMLVSCADDTAKEPWLEEPGNDYTFGVFADIHSSAAYFNRTLDNFFTITNNGEELDGVVMVGDILYTPENKTPNYDFVNESEKYNILSDAGKIAYAMGNHEFPLNAVGEDERVQSSIDLFREKTGLETQADTVWNGYHFITTGPKDYSGVLTAEQESWIIERVENALAESAEKPVFLFIHHPIDNTLNSSRNSDRQSSEFEEFIKGQPRLIVISGHTHYTLSDPHSIYQVPGGTTFLYTSVVYTSVGQSMAYADTDHREFSSQAILLSVNDKTNVVTLKRFYVDEENPTYLEGGDWTFDVPAMIKESKKIDVSTDVYKYTDKREELSVAPCFAEGAEITVSDYTDSSIEISFPNALAGAEGEDSYVGYYKIEVFDTETDELLMSSKIISDFFILNKLDTVSHAFFGMPNAKGWRVSVTPVSTWYVEGAPLTVEVTPPAPEFEEVVFDEEHVYTAIAKDITPVGNSGHYSKYDEYINVTHKGNCTMRYNFDVEKTGKYRVIINAGADSAITTTLSVTYRDSNGNDTVIFETEEKFGTGSASKAIDFTCAEFDADETGTYIVKLKKSKALGTLRVFNFTLARISEGAVFDYIEEDIENGATVGSIILTKNSLLPRVWPNSITREEITWAAEKMGDKLAKLDEACKAVGGKVLYVGIPEQHSMLREDYPEGFHCDGEYLDIIEEEFYKALDERELPYINMKSIFEVEDYRRYYSPTDHHFTVFGAFRTYLEIMDKLEADGLADGRLAEEDFKVTELENVFYGSRALAIDHIYPIPDKISYYEPINPIPFERYDKGVRVNWIHYIPKDTSKSVGYYIYMGGDNPETYIHTNRPELPDIMIVGDSFSNPLEALLYTSFDSLLAIDLRHNKIKSVYDYVEEFKPDILLVVRDDTCYLSFDGNGSF